MLVWVGASVGEEGHVYALRIVSRDKILHLSLIHISEPTRLA